MNKVPEYNIYQVPALFVMFEKSIVHLDTENFTHGATHQDHENEEQLDIINKTINQVEELLNHHLLLEVNPIQFQSIKNHQSFIFFAGDAKSHDNLEIQLVAYAEYTHNAKFYYSTNKELFKKYRMKDN